MHVMWKPVIEEDKDWTTIDTVLVVIAVILFGAFIWLS
jgi:preprotein translocase subunit SecE